MDVPVSENLLNIHMPAFLLYLCIHCTPFLYQCDARIIKCDAKFRKTKSHKKHSQYYSMTSKHFWTNIATHHWWTHSKIMHVLVFISHPITCTLIWWHTYLPPLFSHMWNTHFRLHISVKFIATHQNYVAPFIKKNKILERPFWHTPKKLPWP